MCNDIFCKTLMALVCWKGACMLEDEFEFSARHGKKFSMKHFCLFATSIVSAQAAVQQFAWGFGGCKSLVITPPFIPRTDLLARLLNPDHENIMTYFLNL
jgi:hypothetical protein